MKKEHRKAYIDGANARLSKDQDNRKWHKCTCGSKIKSADHICRRP